MENQKNNWITLSSEIKYDNPWITLTEHQVINPSGGNGIYGMVHFKNLAIGIVAIDYVNDEPFIYLVGQFRFPLEQYSLEIPEGGGSLETPHLESAQRELSEETGLMADKWELILTMHLSNSVSDEVAYIYLATNLQKGIAHPEETEELTIFHIPLKEAYHWVNEGKITDSMSVAAILKTYMMLSL